MSKYNQCLVCEVTHDGSSTGGLMFCSAKHRNEYFCGDNADVVDYCQVCGEVSNPGRAFCSANCEEVSVISSEELFKGE